MFEGTARFGGRIETVEMGGFLAEYGPMRFEKMAQPLLMDLITELGLETKYFTPYTAANDFESLFDLTFDESRGQCHGNKLTTLELLKLGILRLLNASCGDMDDPDIPGIWNGGPLLTKVTTAMCVIRLHIMANISTRWVSGTHSVLSLATMQ